MNKIKITAALLVGLLTLGLASTTFSHSTWFTPPKFTPAVIFPALETTVGGTLEPTVPAANRTEETEETTNRANNDQSISLENNKSVGETTLKITDTVVNQKPTPASKDQSANEKSRQDSPSKTTQSRTIASRGVSSRGFIWPVQARISSYYGPRGGRLHKGLDLAAPTGQQIKAARTGTVIYSGWVTGYGQTIMLDHGDGLLTLYGHCSKLLAQTGQKVSQGEVIALVGSTGRSTGPHLHFEILVNGQAVNPLLYLP